MHKKSFFRKYIYITLLFYSLIPGVTVTRAQSIIFSPDIVQTIEGSRAHGAFWSVIIRDSTGRILDGYNFDKEVRPASNLKLLTSATVLDELGSDFRYKTYMYGLGEQNGSIWNGDIIIRGSGDPSISGDFYNKDRFHVFDEFFSTLDSAGIDQINGNLIGNDSYFDDQVYPKGWSWDDLSFYYGVEISALSFNNNAVDLTVFSNAKIGETPRIEWFPFDTDYVNFINEQVITPQNSEYDEYYRRILGTNTIILRSKVPRHYHEKESLSVMNAPLFFMDTFDKYLKDGGIRLTGRIIIDNQPQEWEDANYKVLDVHHSVPLEILMKQLNKDSDNFYAEMMLKTVAAEHFNTQGSTELGISLVDDFAYDMGMDTTRLKMTDGSGMSSATLLTVEGLSKLLVNMQSRPDFSIYKNSLSIAGVDGSLKHRFLNTPLKLKIYGKTGYVSGVRSLSGYMRSETGRPLIFSIVTNNYTEPTSYIDSLHESILQQIYKKY